MKNVLIFLFILSISSVYGQEDGSESFNKLRDTIKPSVPDGYIVNKGQTWDNRFAYKITYNENGSEEHSLIYEFIPDASSFSELDQAMATEEYTWQGRKAIYQDGSQTGMSSIVILLKNNKGKFTLSNMTLDLTAMDKAALKNLLSHVDLTNIE